MRKIQIFNYFSRKENVMPPTILHGPYISKYFIKLYNHIQLYTLGMQVIFTIYTHENREPRLC